MKRLLLLAGLAVAAYAQQTMTLNGVPNQVVILPNPTASALGGIESITSLTNNWIAYIDTSGVPHQSQPAFSNLNGSAACGQLPALTGDVTTTAGSCATTVVQIEGAAIPASAAVVGTNSSKQQIASSAHQMSLPLACADSSGSGTAQSCSTSPSFTPASGDWILYTTTTANTGDVTINVNSLGAKHVRKYLGASVLASGDLPANTPMLMVYDGTYFELPVIGNAPAGSGTVNSSTINYVAYYGATGTAVSGEAQVTPAQGGTGVGNGTNNTITFTGNYTLGITLSANTALTFPTSGTLAILGLNTFTKTQTYAVNTVASGGTPAFDLSLGNVQYVSALATNAVPSFSNITTGGTYDFVVCNNGTGGYTWTWPASVHGGITIGTTASKCSEQSFVSPDGTNLYAKSMGVINQ